MKDFFSGWSKKLVAFIVYVGVVILNEYLEIDLSEETIRSITAAMAAYVLSQGISDFGKERERIRLNGKSPK